MAAYTGKNLYILWDGTSIESDYRSFDPSESMGTDDASAGSDAAVTRKTTLKDGSASLTMRSVSGTAGTALWNSTLAVGTEGTLEWGPEGTASNNQRHYVNAILTSKSETNAYANVVEWSCEWEFSGEVTHTTYA